MELGTDLVGKVLHLLDKRRTAQELRNHHMVSGPWRPVKQDHPRHRASLGAKVSFPHLPVEQFPNDVEVAGMPGILLKYVKEDGSQRGSLGVLGEAAAKGRRR